MSLQFAQREQKLQADYYWEVNRKSESEGKETNESMKANLPQTFI